jgi:dTDP-4-amino-4,6-dideoxygalactose transaminase
VPAERDPGHVYHLFVVRAAATGPHDCRRAELQAWLRGEGIETFVHYPVPIPRQPAFADTHPADCPRADAACREVLSLPIHPGLTESDVGAVAAAIHAFPPAHESAHTRKD